MQIHSLMEQRSNRVSEMRSIADKAEAESRDYTPDEDTRHKTLKTEIAELERKIERARDIQEAERAAPAVISGNGRDGAYEARAREFSVTTAIRSAMGERVDDGRERELSAELRRRAGRSFEGIAVPDQVFQVERRTLLTSGDAADLVPNTHRPDLFIDMRRSAVVTERLGATVLDGLVGTVDIPRQSASGTAAWIAEDSALSETDADFDDVNLAPKTVGSMTSYSRRTMINAVPSIEQLVRRDLAAVLARSIDYQALMGNGSGNTPTGILNASGVATPSLAGPTWAQVLGVIAAIQSADADFGSMAWAMNPNAVAKLRATPKDSTNGGEGYLMESANAMAGYAAGVTTAVPDIGGPPATDRYAFFGDFSQLLIARWEGISILVNPFGDAAYSRGRVQVRAMQDVDVGVRHGASFAVANDLPV